MSDLRVNQIVSTTDGAPDFDSGLVLSLEETATGITINSSGTVTATSFVGDGSALTGITGVSDGLAFGIALIG